MFYSLLHLVAFRWEAHGKSLATFLSGTKKMPESLALSKFLYLSHTLHTPVSRKTGRDLLRLETSEMAAGDSGFCGFVFVFSYAWQLETR